MQIAFPATGFDAQPPPISILVWFKIRFHISLLVCLIWFVTDKNIKLRKTLFPDEFANLTSKSIDHTFVLCGCSFLGPVHRHLHGKEALRRTR